MQGGYQLAEKFLRKWDEPTPPRSLKGLQRVLGKLLWASPFIPEYKGLVTPLEELLSGSSPGVWTAECTDAVNKLTELMY